MDIFHHSTTPLLRFLSLKLSIRAKVFLRILPVLLLMEGVIIGVYVQDRRETIIQTNEQQFEALAQMILVPLQNKSQSQPLDLETLTRSAEELNALCSQLYELNQDNNVTHVAVIDENKMILAHNDKKLVNTEVEGAEMYQYIGWRRTKTFEENGIYHTLVPIVDETTAFLGAIDIGFPESVVRASLLHWFWKALRVAAFFLLGTCGLIMLSMHFVVAKPLKYLAALGDQLVQGHVIRTISLSNRDDEIADLATKFMQMSQYLQDVTAVAERVATGKLHHEIQKRSKRDTLSVALQEMLTYLQDVAMFASKIAGGDLTMSIPLRSDVDAFGRAMRSMRTGLQTLIQQIRDSAEQLATISTGIATLADQDMDIAATGYDTVETLSSIITQMGMSAEEIASNMNVLSASVEQTSASVLEMTNSISSIASSAADLEQQTRATISELEQATGTLESVTEKAGVSRTLSEGTIQDALEGQQAVEQVTKSMDTIQQTNSGAVEAITRFAQQTEDIDKILDVINEITDRSELLALNASIIAAQAGAHGRGFAVIADEMRELANKVNTSTKDIATIVQTVQKETGRVVQEIHRGTKGIEQGVQRTQHAQKMLEKIIGSAQRSSSVVAEMVTALQEMQKTTDQDMKLAMKQVHNMTAAITKATKEQKSSTLQINDAVEHIRDMAVQTQAATSQQLQGVPQVLEVSTDVKLLTEQSVQSSQHIEQTAGNLQTQAQTLLQAVDRFKLLANQSEPEQSPEPSQALARLKEPQALEPVETLELVEQEA